MGNSGRISVLVSDELSTLLSATRELPNDVDANIRKYTRLEVEPLWQDAVRGRVQDALETRVLSDTARTTVSDQNVLLRSGGIGKTEHGTPSVLLVSGAEFGANRDDVATLTSKNGKRYTRHTKRQFKQPHHGGYVVYPAARDAIPRIASLWVQTAWRTVHEWLTKGGAT